MIINPDDVDGSVLRQIGRGPQLRSPIRLQATVNGQKADVSVKEAASRVNRDAGQWTYRSTFSTGPVDVELDVSYRYDGAITGTITYGGDGSEIDQLELVVPLAGPVSLAWSGTRSGREGIDRTSGLAATVPAGEEEVVWDNTAAAEKRGLDDPFVGTLFFGNPDRGFTWMSPGAMAG